jgi:type IX secretion system PorP/SprF family membrane protein
VKRFFFIIYVLFTGFCEIQAQDPQFSQFYSANLYLAPSFAGSTEGGRVAIIYRNQWPGIENQFNTYNLAIDHYFPKYHSGLGAYILRDAAGSGKMVATNFYLQYSYTFKITHVLHAKPGLQVGYIHRGLDYNKLIFGDQLSFLGNKPISNEQLRTDKIGLFDYAASVLFYIEKIWMGVCVDHLPFPNESLLGAENTSPLKISVFGGARLVTRKRLLLKEQDYISFSYLYKLQGPYQQFDIGLYYDRYPMQLGIWYRGLPIIKNPFESLNQDALITKIGVFWQNLSFGYSYDFTFSKLRSYAGGAHEISLVFLFNQYQERDKKKFKALPCPRL